MSRHTVLLFLTALGVFAQPLPQALLNGLEWRFIGPYRGGRVVSATGVPGQPDTFYFGSVGGGVWKTTNAGHTWNPIFDSQKIASIGAIEVAPSNPQIVYVGTGETDMRSAISYGDGMYKSLDAGKTWTHIGLRDSRQIARIRVDPKNPDLVYVAALGHAYGPNAERGVFRSTDGGKTWRKILDKGPDVGAIDLVMEPENPKVLYAAMWNARRPPWSQYGPLEGPGSGLYKSVDGGDTWSQLKGTGLPGGDWGRVGVVVARGTQGKRVYALIDAKEAGGLYRSDDGAKTWARVSADKRINSRGWYFSKPTVDPNNPDIIYTPNVSLYSSKDGGRNFGIVRGAPGGDDYQSLWIDPADSRRMICGSDQGTTITVDGGATWSTWYNQPTAQIYHVAVDNAFPYWVYGAQQDSGTVAVPSRTDRPTMSEFDRGEVGGAESGWIAPDPKDPNIYYVGNTNGSLARFDKRVSQSQDITPWPLPGFGTEIAQRKYRFPWTAPLQFAPLEPNAIYYGSQYLLKTTDGGLHWREMSPDLTGDDRKPGAPAQPGPTTTENAKARGYGVLYSIAPSPLEAKLIWVGSDTGLLHVTRDGAKTWGNVTPKGLTDWSKITHIEASHFEPTVAYAAVDRHRLDDYQPHLYRTRDFGQTWTAIQTGIADGAFVNSIEEDPARRGLLFAATELGMYVSFDDGDHWQPLQLNLPVTSVRDVLVHGRDLVIATHGRGFWILDDISPLRQGGTNVSRAEVWLYKPSVAYRINNDTFQGTPMPPEIPQMQNPPNGAIIDYYLTSIPHEPVVIEILDAKGQLIRRVASNDPVPPVSRRDLTVADRWLKAPARPGTKAGVNRFVWDLKYPDGPLALPGKFTVRLTAAGRKQEQPLDMIPDPRSVATAAELQAQFDLATKAATRLKETNDLAERIRKRPASADRDALLRRVTRVSLSFQSVEAVAESADRMPPAQAYELMETAEKELEELKRD
ncbi:MAG: hypothetical protein ABI823_10805 [Bryobacteraceae bacterium]